MDTSTALWTLASSLIIGLAYFAGLAFVLGLLWRLWGYLRTPMPWPETTTPAPETEGGAVARVIGDVLLFPNLFKSDKSLWAGAWIFHVALFVILFRHVRYFTYPVPGAVISIADVSMRTIGLWAGYIFGIAAIYLFWRRLALPRTLYVSGLPLHPLFLIHFLLVLGLMLYFPFSKLLHAGGIFFSPTRNQPYEIQKRGKRYVNPWDYPVR
jgi:nitrate reductase gamma subunit